MTRTDFLFKTGSIDAALVGPTFMPHWTDDTTPRAAKPVRFWNLTYRMGKPGNLPRGPVQDRIRRFTHNAAPVLSLLGS